MILRRNDRRADGSGGDRPADEDQIGLERCSGPLAWPAGGRPALAGINVLYLPVGRRPRGSFGSNGDAALAAKIVAASSVTLWVGVIIFGRLIMYDNTLLCALGL